MNWRRHQQETLCQSTDAYLGSTTQYKGQHVRQNQNNTYNCRRNDPKNMARTKVTPRRRERTLQPWILRQNRNLQGEKRTYPYKIKITLPKQKEVDIKKNEDIIKTKCSP